MAPQKGGIRPVSGTLRTSIIALLVALVMGSLSTAPPSHAATAIDYNVAQSIIITVDIFVQWMAEALFHRKEAVRTGDFELYLKNWLIPMIPKDSVAVAVAIETEKLTNDRRLFLQANRNPYDLEVTDVSFPDGTQPGAGRRVLVTIANTGYETAPFFRVKLFRVPVSGGAGVQTGFTRAERMLEPGPVTGTQPATQIPSSVPVAYWQPSTRVVEFNTTLEPGDARYRATVELVAENSNMGDADEYDNFKEIQVSVPMPPWTPTPTPPLNDLEVADVAFPYGLIEGEGRVRVVIRSNGPSSSGTPRVRLYGGVPGSLNLIEERALIGTPGGVPYSGVAVSGITQSQEFTVRFTGEMEFRAEAMLDPMGDAALHDPISENNIMTVRAVAEAPTSDTSGTMTTGYVAPYVAGTITTAAGMTTPTDLAVLGVSFPDGTFSGRYSTVSVRVRNNSARTVQAAYLTKVLYRARGSSAWIPFVSPGGLTMTTAMPASGYSAPGSGYVGPIDPWSSRDVGIMGMIETPGEYEFRAEVEIDPSAGYPPDPNPANNSLETVRSLAGAPPPETDMEVVSVAGEPEDGGFRVIAVVRNNGPLLCSESELRVDLLDASGSVVRTLSVPANNIPSGWTSERVALLEGVSALDAANLHARVRVISASPIDIHPENDSLN